MTVYIILYVTYITLGIMNKHMVLCIWTVRYGERHSIFLSSIMVILLLWSETKKKITGTLGVHACKYNLCSWAMQNSLCIFLSNYIHTLYTCTYPFVAFGIVRVQTFHIMYEYSCIYDRLDDSSVQIKKYRSTCTQNPPQ